MDIFNLELDALQEYVATKAIDKAEAGCTMENIVKKSLKNCLSGDYSGFEKNVKLNSLVFKELSNKDNHNSSAVMEYLLLANGDY